MTEAEWLTATDPMPMVQSLEGKASNRKLRLFAVACCRRVWHRLAAQRNRTVVELAEAFADGLVSEEQIKQARDAIWQGPKLWPTPWACANPDAFKSALFTLQNATRIADRSTDIKSSHPDILRDIFGNPFRPISVDPSWRSATVVALAEGSYQDRAFDRLPILADALQDAGCDYPDILDHCRGPGPHVRGCWVVDFLTGRK